MRLTVLIVAGLIVLSACAPTDEKVVIIGPNQVPCEQGSPEPCYLIKESPSEPWIVMDSRIEQLEPEDGYQYTVLVRERDRMTEKTTPRVTFHVVDVLEKREVMGRIMWYYG